MNAMTARTELAFDTDRRVSTPTVSSRPAARPSRLAAALRWIVELPRHRAVINELRSLSDHELADIGLERGDIPHLFDRGSAGRRSAA
jgi:uncharacterized protein YjiS (DUF1127 family)